MDGYRGQPKGNGSYRMLHRQVLTSKGKVPALCFSTAGVAVHSVKSRALPSFVGTILSGEEG